MSEPSKTPASATSKTPASDSAAPAPGGLARRPASPTPSAALVKALRTLLRPLVRGLVEHGITFPFLANLLKGVYVEVVDKDFPLAGKPQTASRISVMSGVHRKDVRRLLEEADHDPPTPKAVSVGARLLAIWTGSPDYADEQGRPLPLPRASGDPNALSFQGLVESINRKDVRPRAILDELVRLGVATVDAGDMVRLHDNAFVPSEGFEELAHYYGRNLRDHIAASTHNLSDRETPFPERAVYYNRLTPESVAALRTLSQERSMEVLLQVNREALRLAERDEGEDNARDRMTLGFYYYSATETTQIDRAEAAARSEASGEEPGIDSSKPEQD